MCCSLDYKCSELVNEYVRTRCLHLYTVLYCFAVCSTRYKLRELEFELELLLVFIIKYNRVLDDLL